MTPCDIGHRLLEDESDLALVDFVIAGNEAAFEVLVRRYRALMRAFALRTLGSNAEADDVVQDAFIVAWEKLTLLKDGEQVKAWLMRIVLNKSIDRLRKRHSTVAMLDVDTPATVDNSPFEVVKLLLQNDALSAALATLPTNQRRAWLMREFSGCSYSVIAVELDVPTSTVRGLLARSRLTLAQKLEAWRY